MRGLFLCGLAEPLGAVGVVLIGSLNWTGSVVLDSLLGTTCFGPRGCCISLNDYDCFFVPCTTNLRSRRIVCHGFGV
jgi:hypothetical protein